MLGDDAGFVTADGRGASSSPSRFLRAQQLPGALADAVDGAFDLPRARLHRRQRIRHRQPQIVMAMHADDRAYRPAPSRSGRSARAYSSGTE